MERRDFRKLRGVMFRHLCRKVENNDPSVDCVAWGYYTLKQYDVEMLVKSIRQNTVATKLRLWNITMTNKEGFKILAEIFTCGKTTASRIQHLVLRKIEFVETNCLEHNFLKDIGTILKMNNNIQRLELPSNHITDTGIAYICNGLAENTTLKHLNLSHNKISCKGATCISKVLLKNNTLTYLRLSDNPIKDEGKLAILYVVKRNFYIKTISISCMESSSTITTINPLNGAIQYYTDLNNFGHRQILKNDDTVPTSLWPDLLAWFGKNCKAEVFYYYIKSKPELFKSSGPVSILGKRRRE